MCLRLAEPLVPLKAPPDSPRRDTIKPDAGSPSQPDAGAIHGTSQCHQLLHERDVLRALNGQTQPTHAVTNAMSG